MWCFLSLVTQKMSKSPSDGDNIAITQNNLQKGTNGFNQY